MRRIILATVGVAARRGRRRDGRLRTARSDDRRRASPRRRRQLPKLPADIKARKRLIVGVKCDVPPFGYIDVQGKNAGFDVEIARRFARYAFGRRSSA